MRIDLAFLNILSNPKKSALAVAGISVAIVLVFMQLGFLGAVAETATNIYDKLDFDVLVRAPDYLHFVDANEIERRQLEELGGFENVQSIRVIRVAIVNWKNPTNELKGILLLGIDPGSPPFRKDAELKVDFGLLDSDESLLIDCKSHFEFGPANQLAFTDEDVGRVFEISGIAMRICGLFEMGAGLAANGAAIVNEKAFERLVPTTSSQKVTLGLVSLKPGTNVAEFVDAFHTSFPTRRDEMSTQVLSRDDVNQFELTRWIQGTPIGYIFTLGVVIAIFVGAAIVYMVLGNDVANRLHEYATLRAMGYSNLYMCVVVLKQAVYLALFSFAPALLISYGLYYLVGNSANISLRMNGGRILLVLCSTLGMSILSGTFALNKLWKAAPADLF